MGSKDTLPASTHQGQYREKTPKQPRTLERIQICTGGKIVCRTPEEMYEFRAGTLHGVQGCGRKIVRAVDYIDSRTLMVEV